MINKTGLPLYVKSVNSRTGLAKEVAGENRPGMLKFDRVSSILFNVNNSRGTGKDDANQ